MNNIRLGTFNFDSSSNNLNINFENEFMNLFPLPPPRQNISMDFNPFRSNNPLTQLDTINNIINTSILEKNPYKKVASDEAIDSIEIIKYKNDLPQKECPITMMEFEIDEEISKLPCGHLFNTNAINRWLKDEDYKCPVCRRKLEYKEIKKCDISNNIFNDFSGNDISNSHIDFEQLFTRLVQNEVRRNYFNTTIDETVNNIIDEFEEAYDEQLQQIIWESIYSNEH
jgi:hypothetical protein